MSQRHIPSVVVAVDRNGKRVFQRAWGLRNVADRLPANVRTLYQYGSLTKQFTAMAVFLLAQSGKLSLEDDVAKYYPQFANRGITIKHLLIHTSGIADLSSDDAFAEKHATLFFEGPDAAVAWSAARPQEFAPGTKAVYDNTGYVLLARIVEKASGEPFETFLHRHIFLPSGMKVAHGYRLFPIVPNMAAGYLYPTKEMLSFDPHGYQGIKAGTLVNALPWNLRDVDGAGYLIGDAADLQAWDNALLAGKLLTKKWRDLYFSAGSLSDGSPAFAGPENPGKVRARYCYGGLGIGDIGGHTMFAANGGTFGFLTFTAIVPQSHLAVTILTNLGQINNAELTTPIVDALLNAR